MLSPRSSGPATQAWSWEEIFEAGPYFERLAELLEHAQHYAIFVGWQLDSRLPLDRQRRGEGLRARLQRLCDAKPHFSAYILMWDHAYFYMLERETWQARIWEDAHARIHFVFDNRHPVGVSHHEKICIIDGRVALCGGVDLCDERWDMPEHFYRDSRRSLDGSQERYRPYHDLAVQVTGPVCAEIQKNVARRWTRICSVPFPEPPALHATGAGHQVFVSRTEAAIAPATPDHPESEHGVRQVEFLFRDLILGAERKILLEGQYYWSRRINDLLIAKMYERRRAGVPFEIALILARLEEADSPTRHMAPYELQLIEVLQSAARATGTRLTSGAPSAVHPGEKPRPIYIHSKVLIVDDRYISIGSANFAARALRLDTELHLTFEARSSAERAHIRRLSERMLRHWRQPGVRLVPFRPRVELTLFPMRPRLIRWERFFDPLEPWSHPWKRKMVRELSRLKRRRVPASVILLFTAWLSATAFAAALSVRWTAPGPDAWQSAWLSIPLSSVWLARTPFVAWSIAISLVSGWETASRITVASIWIAGLAGYLAVRTFPGLPAGWGPEAKRAIETAAARLGPRNFKAVLSVALDPRIPVHAKVIAQGVRSIPFPWFAWGTGVILPAALFAPLWLADALGRVVESTFGIEFGDGNARMTVLAAALMVPAGQVLKRFFRRNSE